MALAVNSRTSNKHGKAPYTLWEKAPREQIVAMTRDEPIRSRAVWPGDQYAADQGNQPGGGTRWISFPSKRTSRAGPSA